MLELQRWTTFEWWGLPAYLGLALLILDLQAAPAQIIDVPLTDGSWLTNVTLKATDDGIIWRDEASGGLVPYTSFSLPLLNLLGVTNAVEHIQIAEIRAHKKAETDAYYYSVTVPAQLQAAEELRQRLIAEGLARREQERKAAKELEQQEQSKFAGYKDQFVNGYSRANGTQVQSYWRRSPQ